MRGCRIDCSKIDIGVTASKIKNEVRRSADDQGVIPQARVVNKQCVVDIDRTIARRGCVIVDLDHATASFTVDNDLVAGIAAGIEINARQVRECGVGCEINSQHVRVASMTGNRQCLHTVQRTSIDHNAVVNRLDSVTHHDHREALGGRRNPIAGRGSNDGNWIVYSDADIVSVTRGVADTSDLACSTKVRRDNSAVGQAHKRPTDRIRGSIIINQNNLVAVSNSKRRCNI